MAYFFTASGIRIGYGPGEFEARHVVVSDIVSHLERLNRFGGAAARAYSVLRHSLIVAQLVPNDLRRAAVLHDAAEAYLGDIVSPAKAALPGLKELEARICGVIYAALAVPWPNLEQRAVIAAADQRAFHAEAKQLGPPGLCEWLECPEDELARAVLEDVLALPDAHCRELFVAILQSRATIPTPLQQVRQ